MLVTPLEIDTVFSKLSGNIFLIPLSRTNWDIVTLVRLLHPQKASVPMLVTLSGMVTLVRPLQSMKA